MRGMNNPTTSLASIQKDFPFESRLSLTLLIKFWEDLAKADTLSGEHARSLLARLREVRALIPFTLRSVYGTHAFESIMGPDGVLYGSLNLDMQALKDFRLVNAYALALERLYGIEFPVDYPLILTAPEPVTGLDRHYKIQFDGRFVDVDRLLPIPPLSEDMRRRLQAQALDLDGLAALIPAGSVRFSGFTVVKAADVTDQEVLSSIKRDLIDKESIVSNARFEKLQAKLRTLFRRADLRLTLAAIEGDRILMLNSGHQLEQGNG